MCTTMTNKLQDNIYWWLRKARSKKLMRRWKAWPFITFIIYMKWKCYQFAWKNTIMHVWPKTHGDHSWKMYASYRMNDHSEELVFVSSHLYMCFCIVFKNLRNNELSTTHNCKLVISSIMVLVLFHNSYNVVAMHISYQ